MEAKNLRDILDYVEEYDIKEWQLTQVIWRNCWTTYGSEWEALGIPVRLILRTFIDPNDDYIFKRAFARSKYFTPDARVMILQYNKEDWYLNGGFLMELMNQTGSQIMTDGILPLNQYNSWCAIFWNGNLEDIAKPTQFRHMPWIRQFQEQSEPVKETRSLWNDREIQLKEVIGKWYFRELGLSCRIPNRNHFPFPLIRQPNPYMWKKIIKPLTQSKKFELAIHFF